jgi:oligogalacturonide lyase
VQGKIWKSETSTFKDRDTGVSIRRLTSYRGHSHAFYFTNPGWYDGGSRLLFGSDRNGKTDLFSLELKTGSILQLTDLEDRPDMKGAILLWASLNQKNREVYYWHGKILEAVHLDSLKVRELYRVPAGFDNNMANVTCDGRYVCTALYEDLSGKFEVDLLNGYIGFGEYWEAMPLSKIIRIPVTGGLAETLFEENYWIGHVNTSPTQPTWLTYCHEGPWDKVDQRIWGLDMETRKTWKIRPGTLGDMAGHEYWLADGLRVGYHGGDKKGPFFGFAKWDNSQVKEYQVSNKPESWHFSSLDDHLVVSDGNERAPFILLWKREGERIFGPRKLCRHDSSLHSQGVHPHPAISPDRKSVLYTADKYGYGDVFLAELTDFEGLPEVRET